jgi:hypothetical protein
MCRFFLKDADFFVERGWLSSIYLDAKPDMEDDLGKMEKMIQDYKTYLSEWKEKET